MKYTSKQQRLCAIADTWRTVHGKSSFTTAEVSDWALKKGLWPVPKRGDPKDLCLAWEEKLLAIAEAGDLRC